MSIHAVRRRSARQIVNCDLELRPLMNVFIVLIPMLLMSAVFIEIRVIEMALPRPAEAVERVAEQPFDLAVRIRADAYLVEMGGATLRSIPRGPAAGGADPDAAASAALSQVLAEIAAAHPGHQEIRIVAEGTTRYQEIVTVMDAARAAGLPQAALERAGMEDV